MYGAILGDIIGSPYEFDRGSKTKVFPLFVFESEYTDDTVMTVAVADALISISPHASDLIIKTAVSSSMHTWGRRYPHESYGIRFRLWLNNDNSKPYNSFGNGSAMRVSAVGWLYSTLKQTERVAELTASVSHNHPEGIKGAVATAGCIFLARNGVTKEKIRKYVTENIGYDLTRTLDEIRPTYRHVESCQKTVPEAITAFLESESFEDAIRNAVSLGGDCDTLTAICGSIAEAYYGVPNELKTECRKRINPDMIEVLDAFAEETKKRYNENKPKNWDESSWNGRANKKTWLERIKLRFFG